MSPPQSPHDPKSQSGYISKKCPGCMEYMPLNKEVCPTCKLRVGKINKHGMASRRTDWKAYLTAIVAWLFFFFYVWWAFFREQ